MNKNFAREGFTLIELIVVMAIIVVLYGIITFSAGLYINKGKDSGISGNLATLIPAGEVYYNYSDNSYVDFCDPTQNSVLKNAIDQMPKRTANDQCYNSTTNQAAVCCKAVSQAWAACAKGFVTPTDAYCVDSRGVKKTILNTACSNSITSCP